MAKFLGATKLTGGTTGALDDLLHTELADGDGAIVIDAIYNRTYAYTYDSSSSLSESSPDVIVPDSNSGDGRWILTITYSNDGRVYPEVYGGVGDGATDCTTALQSAFDSGYTVVIPEGTYLTDALTISNNNVRVEGPGTIKLNDSINDHLISVTGNNVTFDGVKLDGNRANNTAGSGIYAVGSDDVTVLNCIVHDTEGSGILFKGGDNFVAKNNEVYDCVATPIIANAEDEAISDVSITDNHVYVTAGSINTTGGIKLYSTGNAITNANVNNNVLDFPISTSAPENQVVIETFGNVSKFTVTNNVVSGGRIGISMVGSHYGTCTGNTVYQPYEIGIEVAVGSAYTTDWISVAGNVVSGSDSGGTEYTKGIALTSGTAATHVKHVSVSNNIVKDCFLPIQAYESGDGSVEDISISGNHVVMASENSRIDIAEVEDLTIRGNHIDNNGQTTATGIKLTDCDRFAVEDNFIFGGISGDWGILVAGTSVDITHGSIRNNSYDGAGTGVALTGYIRYTGDSNTVDITGPLHIKDNLGNSIKTAASGNGNPSVAYYGDSFFLSGSSTITDFIHDYVGAVITIRSTGTSTIQDNAAIILAGSTDFVMASGDVLILKCFSSGVWTEISRSVN